LFERSQALLALVLITPKAAAASSRRVNDAALATRFAFARSGQPRGE
jgi:hypothetical protein